MFGRLRLFVCIGSMVVCVFALVHREKRAEVVFLDVGQGNGTYIAIGDVQILVDAGETNKTLRELGKVHPWWDRSIDVVMASHPDKDHIGMIPYILQRYDVATYIETGKKSESEFHQAIHRELERVDTQYKQVEAHEVIEFTKDLRMSVLHPGAARADDYSDNDSSLVLMLEMLGVSFLFMGDVSIKVEHELIKRYGSALQADVLVVGHHGSKTSTSQELLNAVSPKYGVISSGADNRYGHPHGSVINRLEGNGIQVLRNDKLGTIIFNISKAREFDIVVR